MPGSGLRQDFAGPIVHSAAEALAKAASPGMTSANSARDDLDLAVDTINNVEGSLVNLGFVLGDGSILDFRQYDAGECADRFLDDVAARRDHRPCGVGQRFTAAVADKLERDDGGAMGDDDIR